MYPCIGSSLPHFSLLCLLLCLPGVASQINNMHSRIYVTSGSASGTTQAKTIGSSLRRQNFKMNVPSWEQAFSFKIYPFSSHCLQTYNQSWVWCQSSSENQNQQKKYVPNNACVSLQIGREKQIYFKELAQVIVESANFEIYRAGQQTANLGKDSCCLESKFCRRTVQKLRQGFLCCSLEENSFHFREILSLLLRPSIDRMRFTHIVEGNVLCLKSTDNIVIIGSILSSEQCQSICNKYLAFQLPFSFPCCL